MLNTGRNKCFTGTTRMHMASSMRMQDFDVFFLPLLKPIKNTALTTIATRSRDSPLENRHLLTGCLSCSQQ